MIVEMVEFNGKVKRWKYVKEVRIGIVKGDNRKELKVEVEGKRIVV